MSSTNDNILTITDLETTFTTDEGDIKVLDGVSFSVSKGKTIGVVGESGCGKSVTAASIMGLLPHPYGKVTGGSITYKGSDLVRMAPEELYKTRGEQISMIFQDPMTALNPVHTVGRQLCEVYELHRPEYSKSKRKQAAIDMLHRVGIPAAKQRFNVYPHELSGGMRQRVMIAMALACKPDILIADEPTTALDVTVQAQILKLMRSVQSDNDMGIIFITHDLGVVAETCDEVVVMYAGRVVEQADVYTLFESPKHPYTQGLLRSIPRLEGEPKTKLDTIQGSVPTLREMPSGCRFRNRCHYQTQRCGDAVPTPQEVSPMHYVSCFMMDEINHV
ncbi:ABC transporter ATP-binding protein [Photobacterium lipolyticum]|uniref:ABC-type dipeptide transporter n=1 Tax=Photobacterium lipolyticum TaxID=266810 RepID=A0A2T3MTP1_9GAMM|nr:ABC transporter ATP-binding protein [Photobacterium lipolyticum]PSW02673.1 peptide ABC transporter ATP-binding protein [Photobacterium lipolyticum]